MLKQNQGYRASLLLTYPNSLALAVILLTIDNRFD